MLYRIIGDWCGRDLERQIPGQRPWALLLIPGSETLLFPPLQGFGPPALLHAALPLLPFKEGSRVVCFHPGSSELLHRSSCLGGEWEEIGFVWFLDDCQSPMG